ncbi:hypothetical protein D3C75_775780 [compost metagenome]
MARQQDLPMQPQLINTSLQRGAGAAFPDNDQSQVGALPQCRRKSIKQAAEALFRNQAPHRSQYRPTVRRQAQPGPRLFPRKQSATEGGRLKGTAQGHDRYLQVTAQ